MRVLTTYEYSELPYDLIFEDMTNLDSLEKIKSLENLFSDKYGSMVNFKLNSIAFKNFIGVIKIENLLIEVLPKIYREDSNNILPLEKSEIYKNLTYMIAKTSKLPINIDITNYGGNQSSVFLDFFINMFLQELYTNLFKSIYKSYVSREENLRYNKGRLLVAQNISKNFIPSKVYCEFDEFTENNLINQILKQTTKQMSRVTTWEQNKIIADNIIHTFGEVNNIHLTPETFSYIKEDRLLGNYSKLLAIAKMFVDGHSFDIDSDQYFSNFIFNINMNNLYQEYIFELLNEYRLEIFGEDSTIHSQYSKEHLLYDSDNKGRFLLQPDIVVLDSDTVKIIIDTKYKKLDVSNYRNGVSTTDLYQMFGYYHKYNCTLIFLLYPMHDKNICNQYKLEIDEEPKIFVNTVSLADKLYTSEGENTLVTSLKNIFVNQI